MQSFPVHRKNLHLGGHIYGIFTLKWSWEVIISLTGAFLKLKSVFILALKVLQVARIHALTERLLLWELIPLVIPVSGVPISALGVGFSDLWSGGTEKVDWSKVVEFASSC